MWRILTALAATSIALTLGATVAHAALMTSGCLAQKQKAWGALRKCQAGEKAKRLRGKPGDLAKCTTKFQQRLTKVTEKASSAAIACRYGDNGDGTVTDYDTGLQWEQKTDDGSVHDKDNLYTWSDGGGAFAQPDGTAFKVFLLGTLNNGTSHASVTNGCFAGHCDWRLPAVAELGGIVDCNLAIPCIDQTQFGPTVASDYWSATTRAAFPNEAWFVNFDFAFADHGIKDLGLPVRAVRSDL